MNRRSDVAHHLAACIAQIDVVLAPWGFTFEHDGVHPAHAGLYASGHYVRDATRIGISCRDTVDNLYYEHTFVTCYAYHRELERFGMTHSFLMSALGHADDCWLVSGDNIPDQIAARDGGDRVAALIHDLQWFAKPVLQTHTEEFGTIIRRGYRSFSID